jgi:hypothetical protein
VNIALNTFTWPEGKQMLISYDTTHHHVVNASRDVQSNVGSNPNIHSPVNYVHQVAFDKKNIW